MNAIKKIVLKCKGREVKVSQTIANQHGVSDGQTVTPEKLQEVVRDNSTFITNLVKVHGPGRVN